MKRKTLYITAAVIGIAVFFCLFSACLPLSKTQSDPMQAGQFPLQADKLLRLNKQSFSDTYAALTGDSLSEDCLLSQTAAAFSRRAVWVSYSDWMESLSASDQETFTKQADTLLQSCKSLGLDTVILQLRAFGDAFYPSALYPQSKYCAAKGFDPLAVFLQSAAMYGMQVEAWVNPFRLDSKARMDALPKDSALGALYHAADSPMRQAENGIYWLDPADKRALGLITQGIDEVLDYGFAVLWFDDYFYSGVSPKEFGYGAKKARAALDHVIKSVALSLHEQGVQFGISPQGNLDAALTPASDQKLYTSLGSWCSKGYLDIIMPQVYYGFSHETADYQTICGRWEDLLQGSDTALCIALAAYKCGKEDKFAGTGADEWKERTDIIARQIAALEGRAKGFSLFRYGSLAEQEKAAEHIRGVLR